MNKIVIGLILTISLALNIYLALYNEPTNSCIKSHTVEVTNSMQDGNDVQKHSNEIGKLEKRLTELYAQIEKAENRYEMIDSDIISVDENTIIPLDQEGANADFEKHLNSIDPNSEEFESIKTFVDSFKEITDPTSEMFTELNTDKLTVREKELFDKFLERMKRIEELKQKESTADSITEQFEARQNIINEMMSGGSEMKLARKLTMESLADSLGYEKEDAKKFTDYIDYVYKATNPSGFIDNMSENSVDGGGQAIIQIVPDSHIQD